MNVRICGLCGSNLEELDVHWCHECFLENSEVAQVRLKLATVHEPPAVEANEDPMWPKVVEDMIARDKMGHKKHGTRLQAGNGRNHLVDAYQESLDMAVYLRCAIELDARNKAEIKRLKEHIAMLEDV